MWRTNTRCTVPAVLGLPSSPFFASACRWQNESRQELLARGGRTFQRHVAPRATCGKDACMLTEKLDTIQTHAGSDRTTRCRRCHACQLAGMDAQQRLEREDGHPLQPAVARTGVCCIREPLRCSPKECQFSAMPFCSVCACRMVRAPLSRVLPPPSDWLRTAHPWQSWRPRRCRSRC